MNEHDLWIQHHQKLAACAMPLTFRQIPHIETETSQKNWSFFSLLKTVENSDKKHHRSIIHKDSRTLIYSTVIALSLGSILGYDLLCFYKIKVKWLNNCTISPQTKYIFLIFLTSLGSSSCLKWSARLIHLRELGCKNRSPKSSSPRCSQNISKTHSNTH